MAEVLFIDLKSEVWEDSRGFSFYPLKGRARDPQSLPDALHLVSLAPGTSRGNHLHPGQWEWLYPFHGAGIFIWQPHPGELKEQRLSGHHLLIGIPPGIPHAVRNPGPDPLYLLAWREGEAKEGEETVPYPLG